MIATTEETVTGIGIETEVIADAPGPRITDLRDANTKIRTRPVEITALEKEKTDMVPGETIASGTEVQGAGTMTDRQEETVTYLTIEEEVALDAAAVIVVDEKTATSSLRKREAGRTVLHPRSENLRPI